MTDKRCLICDSPDVVAHGRYSLGKDNRWGREGGILELPLLYCNSCGFVYVFPLPGDKETQDYYKTSDFWQAKMSTPPDYHFSGWAEVFESNPSLHERLLRAERQFAYINKNKKLNRDTSVLDVGAGFSPFLYICNRHGLKKLYAIEPFRDICSFLKKQGVEVMGHTIEEWLAGNPDRKYDLIVASHLLEHLRDPLYFLSEIGKFLKPEGRLYIEVPHRDDRQKFHCGLHFYFFDLNTLRLYLKKYAFRVIDIRNVKYNLGGLIVRKFLLLYYALFRRKRSFSIHNSFFSRAYYRFWLPLKRLLRLRLYIYISSNDIISLSSLNSKTPGQDKEDK